jgi:hypothetical protein
MKRVEGVLKDSFHPQMPMNRAMDEKGGGMEER